MKGNDCGFLHQFDKQRMPTCRFFAKYNECKEPDCPFKHSLEDVKDCNMYKLGFCIHGPNCRYRHPRSDGDPPDIADAALFGRPGHLHGAAPRHVRQQQSALLAMRQQQQLAAAPPGGGRRAGRETGRADSRAPAPAWAAALHGAADGNHAGAAGQAGRGRRQPVQRAAAGGGGTARDARRGVGGDGEIRADRRGGCKKRRSPDVKNYTRRTVATRRTRVSRVYDASTRRHTSYDSVRPRPHSRRTRM